MGNNHNICQHKCLDLDQLPGNVQRILNQYILDPGCAKSMNIKSKSSKSLSTKKQEFSLNVLPLEPGIQSSVEAGTDGILLKFTKHDFKIQSNNAYF
jgi:hypothetical protein